MGVVLSHWICASLLYGNRKRIQTLIYHKSKYSKVINQAYRLLIKYVLSIYIEIYTFIVTLKVRVKFIILWALRILCQQVTAQGGPAPGSQSLVCGLIPPLFSFLSPSCTRRSGQSKPDKLNQMGFPTNSCPLCPGCGLPLGKRTWRGLREFSKGIRWPSASHVWPRPEAVALVGVSRASGSPIPRGWPEQDPSTAWYPGQGPFFFPFNVVEYMT